MKREVLLRPYRFEEENKGSREIFDITEFVTLDLKKNKLFKEHNLKKLA